jgi:hypothetical protein
VPKLDVGARPLGDGDEHGRRLLEIDLGDRTFRAIDTPEEQPATHQHQTRVERVQSITTCFQNLERVLKGPVRSRRHRVARGQRDLCVCYVTASSCNCFAGTEGPSRSRKELLRSSKLPQLCHRNAAQRQRIRILPKRDPLECTSGSPAASARAAAVHSESIPPG